MNQDNMKKFLNVKTNLERFLLSLEIGPRDKSGTGILGGVCGRGWDLWFLPPPCCFRVSRKDLVSF